MQGHQLDTVLVGIRLGFTGIKGGLGDEFRQRVLAVFHLKIRQGVDQFFQVLHPGLALLAFLVGVVILQAAESESFFHQTLKGGLVHLL